MDKLDTLTLFVRIVERGSFSAAAADLGFFPAGGDRGHKGAGGQSRGAAAAAHHPARTTVGGGLAVLSALRGYSGGP